MLFAHFVQKHRRRGKLKGRRAIQKRSRPAPCQGARSMPVHNWTLVTAGTFHDFHCTWIPLIKIQLNDGLLPEGYYAQVEQVAGQLTTDVLTLQTDRDAESEPESQGGIAGDVAPPQVEITASLEAAHYTARARRLVVRHSSDDRVVA